MYIFGAAVEYVYIKKTPELQEPGEVCTGNKFGMELLSTSALLAC